MIENALKNQIANANNKAKKIYSIYFENEDEHDSLEYPFASNSYLHVGHVSDPLALIHTGSSVSPVTGS